MGWKITSIQWALTSSHQRYGMAQGGLVLIRPDGYIGLRKQSLAIEPLLVYFKKLFLPLEVPVGDR